MLYLLRISSWENKDWYLNWTELSITIRRSIPLTPSTKANVAAPQTPILYKAFLVFLLAFHSLCVRNLTNPQFYMNLHSLGWTTAVNLVEGRSVERLNKIAIVPLFTLTYEYITAGMNPSATTIDYRSDNMRFWLSAHNCQVPTPTSQNLELEQPIRTFGADWLTHFLHGRLKSTISNLQMYIPKKANSEKLGLAIDNPCRIFFWVCGWISTWRGSMAGIFGIL